MTQILGNLSKNKKRNITQTRPSAQCPLLPSVQSSHSFTHPSFCPSSPSLSVYTSTLSTCSLRPSALSVHPSVCQLCPFHPSTLCCPSLCAVCSSLRPSACLFILSVHQSRPSSWSVCSVLPFVHPSISLSIQFVWPSDPSAHQLSGWQRERQFCTCTTLFVHFFAVGVQIQLETSTFHAFSGRKRKTTIFHSDKVFYN